MSNVNEPGPESPKKPKMVLVVDDDREIVASIKAVLENKGYRVLTANDGNQGVFVAEREHPDLLIIDMMMPKRSGFLVAEKLRQQETVPPIIMITANEGSRHRAYAELLGVKAYLRKPFAMERLLDEVEKLLSGP